MSSEADQDENASWTGQPFVDIFEP